MKSDNALVRLIVNALAGTLIGGLLVGLLGMLFAGSDGFLNGFILGAVFGFLGGLATPSTRLANALWFTRGLARHSEQREEDKYER